MSDNFEDRRGESPALNRLDKQAKKAQESQQLVASSSAYDAEYRKRGSAGTKVASQKLKNLQDSNKTSYLDRTGKAPEMTKGFQTNAAIVSNNLKGPRK